MNRPGLSRPKLLRYWPVPLVLAIDWLSKTWAEGLYGGVKTLIPGALTINAVRNAGGFLGALAPLGQAGGRWLIAAATLAAAALALWLAWRTPPARAMRHYGFACMIGGALGNAVSRIVDGYVLDFLQIGPLPIFNLADLALLAGMIVAIIDVLLESDKER